MNAMFLWSLAPIVSFLVLLGLESRVAVQKSEPFFTRTDWLMNLSGFLMQGLVIPLLGYLLAVYGFPALLPKLQGILPLGFIGAFLLNFIGVDFLYYLQHRAFHEVPWLWKLHAPHHHSPVVNIWATSRNALITHFLFVYMLVNPILGYLCNSSEGFFAGAMLTAALDLFRHSALPFQWNGLNGIFILPADHHRHHDAERPFANYGANFMLWDRLFNTADRAFQAPKRYAVHKPPTLSVQLLYPWKAKEA